MPASFPVPLAPVIAVLLVPGLQPVAAASGQASAQAACHEWRACRQLALDAAARGDYETFHDLAWRAVQTGPPADPDLMYLLARAQCLSGRPHDALVMLERLADRGVWTDAETNDDFRRTRALPGWPAVKAAIERVRAAAADPAPPPPEPSPPARSAPAPSTPEPSAPEPGRPVPFLGATVLPAPSLPAATAPLPTPPSPVSPPPAPSPTAERSDAPEPEAPALAMAVVEAPVEEAARFSTAPFAPGGLAYDAISRRFVFGDLAARRVKIVAEGMRHTVNLVGATSAGFHDVMALEIDERRGDLWVVSAAAGGGAAALHKLQLVSGRPLATFEAPAALEPLMFTDVAVTAAGTALVLDRAGRRVFGLEARAATLELLVALDVEAPTSLAPADERVAYVAHRDGIARLDLRTRTARPVVAPAGIEIGGFERIRWYRESLVGVQALADGSRRVVRLMLAPGGRAVTAGTVIRSSIPAGAGPTCATISGDDLYYLVSVPRDREAGGRAASGPLAEILVERTRLR